MTNSPTPSEIKAARLAAGLTQPEAAALVYSDIRAWQFWEAGQRNMPAAKWELFTLKTKKGAAMNITVDRNQNVIVNGATRSCMGKLKK